jgi:hypothetical protein
MVGLEVLELGAADEGVAVGVHLTVPRHGDCDISARLFRFWLSSPENRSGESCRRPDALVARVTPPPISWAIPFSACPPLELGVPSLAPRGACPGEERLS